MYSSCSSCSTCSLFRYSSGMQKSQFTSFSIDVNIYIEPNEMQWWIHFNLRVINFIVLYYLFVVWRRVWCVHALYCMSFNFSCFMFSKFFRDWNEKVILYHVWTMAFFKFELIVLLSSLLTGSFILKLMNWSSIIMCQNLVFCILVLIHKCIRTLMYGQFICTFLWITGM